MVKVTIETPYKTRVTELQSVALIGNGGGSLTAGIFGTARKDDLREQLAIGAAHLVHELYADVAGDPARIVEARNDFMMDFSIAFLMAFESNKKIRRYQQHD